MSEHSLDCSNCGRSFDMKCAGVEPPMDERARTEWLCRVSSVIVKGRTYEMRSGPVLVHH